MANILYKILGFMSAIILIALAWIAVSTILSFFVNTLVL